MAFCPKVWPEDPVPREVCGCKKCGLFEQGTRMVWGEGNPNASIMIILDNPGAREDRDGKSYVCGTRQTLQKAIHEVDLSENQVYVTYILKRRPLRKYDKDQTRQICIHHLYDQLKLQKPSFIICLGNVAVQAFFENQEIDVKGLRGKFHDVHGYPTMVAYHPLAVRRRPNLQALFIEDFTLLASKIQM